MEHKTYLEWISADLDGELSPSQQEQLQAHLHTCPACAQLYKELSKQSQALQNLDCALPSHLRQDILEHLPPQVSPHRPRTVWTVLAPLAACVVLVATLGYFSQDHTPTVSPRSNPATAAFSIQPQSFEVPGGDGVLLLSAPPSQAGLELLGDTPTTTLESGYVCCVVDPATASALLDLLNQSGQTYTQAAASSPDGSGNTAILWPMSCV